MNRRGRNTAKRPAETAVDPRFLDVIQAFAREPRVSRGNRKGFGSGALNVNGKIFAMMSSKGQFVVKLPEGRVAELAASGKGELFDAGRGRPMKEWVVLTAEIPWIELAQEAYRFVNERA